jgi:hypothetical protein
VAAADGDDRLHVAEVDRLADMRLGETGRIGVPVDGDDPEAEPSRPRDRAQLMPARADEQDRPHASRL